MNWITKVRKLRRGNAQERGWQATRRKQPAPSLSAVEQMEPRLCLGTLNAPPLGDVSGVLEENGAPPAWTSIAPGTGIAGLPPAGESQMPPVSQNHSLPDSQSRSLPDSQSPALLNSTPEQAGGQFAGQTNVSIGLGINGQLLGNSLLGGGTQLIMSPQVSAADEVAPEDATGGSRGPDSQGPAPSVAAGLADAGQSSDGSQASAGPSSTGLTESGSIDSDTLANLGFTLDANGNATSIREWWMNYSEPVVVNYDFRDLGSYENEITPEQQDRALDALNAWTTATDGMIQFVHNTEASDAEILNLGTGDLAAFGAVSGTGGILGLGGGALVVDDSNAPTIRGVAWLDYAENWDVVMGNGDPEGTYDYFTTMAHEVGHALGFVDSYNTGSGDIMNGVYDVERSAAAVVYAAQNGTIRQSFLGDGAGGSFDVSPQMTGFPQLVQAEVEQLLNRASAASASQDAIIAIVDRGGNILGVRVEAEALANIPDEETLVFAIDGAVAKARATAFFSNGDPDNGTLVPLTSRTVQFIAQTTVTQREVESNPNAEIDPVTGLRTPAQVYASTEYGPGTVAPIGLGAHFPPGVEFTPPVDLFAIEHTNRDTTIHPGPDGIKATADDIILPARHNVDPAFIPPGQETNAPESYGFYSGRLPNAQARGIGTLPGGVPIFRDTDNDGIGDTLIGGIGVFFPGEDGYATHEQGFVPGIGQTMEQRLNAPRVLEAEYIAFAAVGGSLLAERQGIRGAQIGEINGVARVANIDLPFGRLDLVGITLPVIGPIAGRLGVERILQVGREVGVGDPNSGADQPVLPGMLYRDGMSVPEGFLVTPHDSPMGGLTEQDVRQIIQQAIDGANLTRSAVRLPISSRTSMVIAITDLNGEVLGQFRMGDSLFDAVDVTIAKARNAAYYADPTALQAFDQVVDAGAAFNGRTFRFLAGPRYPDGIDREAPGPFSTLNHPDIDPLTGENIGAPATAGTFDPAVSPDTATVLGYDSFFPNTNFQDPDNPANQNGVAFFPGSIPLYKDGVLVGGLGVSGDGVDQNDVVTFLASRGFEEPNNLRPDQFFFRDVRLPTHKFLRNPFG